MTPIKKMEIEEFIATGYLQELNRRFLHPLGLALEVVVVNSGASDLTRAVVSVWDYRDDPEGICFDTDLLDSEKAQRIYDLETARRTQRMDALGYWIQPMGDDGQTKVPRSYTYMPVFAGYTPDEEKIVIYKRVNTGDELHIQLPNGELWALGPDTKFETYFDADKDLHYVRIESEVWTGTAKGGRRDLIEVDAR